MGFAWQLRSSCTIPGLLLFFDGSFLQKIVFLCTRAVHPLPSELLPNYAAGFTSPWAAKEGMLLVRQLLRRLRFSVSSATVHTLR